MVCTFSKQKKGKSAILTHPSVSVSLCFCLQVDMVLLFNLYAYLSVNVSVFVCVYECVFVCVSVCLS